MTVLFASFPDARRAHEPSPKDGGQTDAVRTPSSFSLKPAVLHEFYTEHISDAPAAAGLITLTAQTLIQDKPLFWLRPLKTHNAVHRGRSFIPYGAGFAALGLNPDHFLFLLMPDRVKLLQAAVDAVRCGGLGAVIMESWGRFPELGLTESRRLALAARASGVTFFSLRLGAETNPSAAETRWQVSAAPSLSPGARAPGAPAFMVECLRNRSGPAGARFHLHWSRDHGLQPIAEAPLPRAVVALSASRTLADDRSHAA